MTKYVALALTNPVEGREEEFNEWYDNQHVPDILTLPGCLSAQRFKLADQQMPNRATPYRYLAIYEYEAASVEAAIAAAVERGGTPAMPRSDAVSREMLTILYAPLGPKVEK